MRRTLPSTIFALLAAVAVLLHLPTLERRPSPFARGAYAVVARAEEALAAGRRGEALRAFRAAYVRTRHEAQSGLSERVRNRVGLAGKALLAADPSAAWPFLEAFALFSPDFSRDGAAVEEWVLEATQGRTHRFTYRLLREDGRTYWGAAPEAEWTGLWPLWTAWHRFTKKSPAATVALEAKPGWPQKAFVLQVALDLRGGSRPFPAALEASGPFAPGTALLLLGEGPPRVVPLEGPGRWRSAGLGEQSGCLPSRLLFFTDGLPPRRGLTVRLVREYRPLFS
ncbi:MAG: hypothetical protein ACP5VN_10600 [Acidobacteriota bacterium]